MKVNWLISYEDDDRLREVSYPYGESVIQNLSQHLSKKETRDLKFVAIVITQNFHER